MNVQLALITLIDLKVYAIECAGFADNELIIFLEKDIHSHLVFILESNFHLSFLFFLLFVFRHVEIE